jgi:hypothetical protein
VIQNWAPNGNSLAPKRVLFITVEGAKGEATGLGRPLGLQVVEDPRISRQSVREGNNVSPKHWQPLPYRRYRWIITGSPFLEIQIQINVF